MECFGEIVKHLRPHPRPLPHKELRSGQFWDG